MYFFGKEQYSLQFKGEQNIYTLKIEAIAKSYQVNSSSNPNFIETSASGLTTDTNPNYVWITGLNFHDENLNVVAKSQLTQPIKKRHNDRILFKVSIDF